MASSPFNKAGGTATATRKAPAGTKADLPDPTNIGDDKPVSSDPFGASDPSGISGVKVQAFLDQLVLVNPTESGVMPTSVSPESNYVRANFIPLTAPDDAEYEVGETVEDVLVFQSALIREFNKALDKGITWLIGRLVLGNKKPGQSAPYILVQADDADKALYAEWRKSQV